MKSNKYLYLLSVICLLLSVKVTFAQNISYPVPELGYCQNQYECQLYCEIPQNSPACWSYGKYVLNRNTNDVLGETTGTPTFTFPIAELGNCANATECFVYCSKPQNQTACVSFARKQGLSVEDKEQNQSSPSADILRVSRTELGCDSKQSCKALCDQPANFDRCRAFAKKHGLMKKEENAEQKGLSEEVIAAAQTELGCDSPGSCASFCAKQENRERCHEFGEKYELGPQRNIMKNITPLLRREERMEDATESSKVEGCKTEAECKAYCQKHPTQCPGFPASKITPRLSPSRRPNPSAAKQNQIPVSQPPANRQPTNQYQQPVQPTGLPPQTSDPLPTTPAEIE